MSVHEKVTPEIQETAALLTLGALPLDEAIEFEKHAAACGICASELRQFRETAAQIALSAPDVAPHPRVREKLLAKIQLPDGVSIVRAAEGKWRKTPFPGVSFKYLHIDRETNYATTLLRLEPGAKYPPHRHSGGSEECLVIEGDVRVGDLVLYAGDYERAEAGSVHGTLETDGGCLLLIIASRDDEFLETPA